MKQRLFFLCCGVLVSTLGWQEGLCQQGKPIPIFDGSSFKGWEGDTLKTWRVEKGAIVGGSLTETVPQNEFIATARSYSDFVLRLKFKLEGEEGFINGGVQLRSERTTNPPNEMVGYQADIGNGYWGALYDESRRNRILAAPDSLTVSKLVRQGKWNDYEVRCRGTRIQIVLNGKQTVDYTETDKNIPRSGKLAFQVHGGGKVVVRYKDITIQELSSSDE